MAKTCKIILPVLLFLGLSSSVFAYSTTQVTYTLPNNGNFSNLTFYTNSFFQVGANDFYDTGNGDLVTSDISIPVAIYASGLNPYTGYLNGAYKFSYDLAITGSEAENFRNFNVDFQLAENENVYFAVYEYNKTSTSNSYTLKFNLYFVFHNFFWNSNSGQNLVTAKVHYSDLATNGSTFQCTIVPTLSNGSGNLSHTAAAIVNSEIAVSVASAIDNSSDVESIVSYLNAISSDTALLSQVLSKVTDLDTKMALAVTHLTNIDRQTAQSKELLQALWFALTGMDSVGSFDNNTSSHIKEYWVSIITSALTNLEPSVQPESQKASDAYEQIEENHSIEENVYQEMPSQLSDVNFSPVAPGNIATAISITIGWIEALYNQLGIFQWVIILTCTVGIVLIVLGRFRMR